MARLGVPAAPLLPGRAGEPLWPPGLTGSITHCAGYRACAVARATEVAAVGIDAEPNRALPAGLAEAVATGAERAWVREHAVAVPTVCWDRLLFSAKEAAGKLWYPLAGRWPGFHDAVIQLATTGTFTARLPATGPGAGDLGPARLTGRWLSRDGLLITAIAWTP
jgi:4'-phosphopantetheinyl transferase EntD